MIFWLSSGGYKVPIDDVSEDQAPCCSLAIDHITILMHKGTSPVDMNAHERKCTAPAERKFASARQPSQLPPILIHQPSVCASSLPSTPWTLNSSRHTVCIQSSFVVLTLC